MLHPAKRLAREGAAVHWLREESKAPVHRDWSNAEVNTPESLERTYRDGYNVGVRLGRPSQIDTGLFLYVLDMDVKGDDSDADEAYAALRKILPQYQRHPYVQSGRGGESQHIYLCCTEDLPSKKLAHSDRKVKWTDKDGKDHHSWAWEIERFGTGKQVAAPPSIHPETQKEYTWGQEIDWDDLASITVSAATLEPLDDERGDRRDRSSTRPSESSLSEAANKKTLGLDEDEAWDYLMDLNRAEWCDDRDGWLKVGMACHHEFNGSEKGYKLWYDFSKESDKFNADDLERVWDSFGGDDRRRPVRFATIKAAGAPTRELRERKGASDDDDDGILDEEDPETRAARLIPRTESGAIKVSSTSVRLLLETDVRTRGMLGLNLFSNEVCIVKSAGFREALSERKQKDMIQLEPKLFTVTEEQEKEGIPLTDAHYHALRDMLEAGRPSGGYGGIKIPDRDLETAISNLAYQNTFHPIQVFLNGLVWDGKKRIDRMFIDYLGCPNDEYHRETSRLWLLAGVTRVFQPGHKFDFVPIIEGVQGLRKSTFIQTLAVNPHWFVELRGDIFDDPKKVVETLDGSWIAEIPELNSFTKSDLTAVKAFFSAGGEKVRESYGRKAKSYQRQSVYMGSTNDAEYLRDPTGNRRFWPIKTSVEQIDTDKLAENVLQLWAEAVNVYHQMAKQHKPGHLPLYLTGKAREAAKKLQDSRMIETQTQGWAGLIAEWANTRVRQSVLESGGANVKNFKNHDSDDPLVLREYICATQVWREVLDGSKESYGRGSSTKVVEAIRATGDWVEHGQMRLPIYGPQKVFKRADKAPRKSKRSFDDILG